jgi:peptidoglycan L-alanyl-D-glutamate endopeptidase CwlK
MPAFSAASLEKLATCDQRLQDLFTRVIEYWDSTILVGHRGKEAQDLAVATGRSKDPWPTSHHNTQPSEAVDAAPYPIDWDDLERFYYFAGFVKGTAALMGIRIRWGGDWASKNEPNPRGVLADLVHFELVKGAT